VWAQPSIGIYNSEFFLEELALRHSESSGAGSLITYIIHLDIYKMQGVCWEQEVTNVSKNADRVTRVTGDKTQKEGNSHHYYCS
jgi:hypothetical protein